MASQSQQQQRRQQQQEMVQVDRFGPAYPFWSAGYSGTKKYGSNTVVEASSSHTDILRLDQLTSSPLGHSDSLSESTRQLCARSSPRASSRSLVIDLEHKPFSYLQPSNYVEADENDDDDDEVPEITFDDDEDEFGLPSIASIRRNGKRKGLNRGADSSDDGTRSAHPVGTNPGSAHWRMNSGDIAEERNESTIPMYPLAKPPVGKILRPQYKDILFDPATSLHLMAYAALPPEAPQKVIEEHSAMIGRVKRFKRLLQSNTISLPELRSTAWSGIPMEVRPMTWQLLLGYLPARSERRTDTLERKRKEYLEAVRQVFEKTSMGIDQRATPPLVAGRARGRGLDETIWHQISIDVPRTSPHIELYGYEATQRSLERILYVWAIRHPASGYVQGINDLVTPFWQVFLGAYITDPDVTSGMDPGQLPKPVLDAVEADSFWCLTKLLDGIQDNYVSAQPGIQRQVASLRDLTARIDQTLATHLENEGVEFIQFSFRWMNCLLMREISIKNTIRMWDTYVSEERGFSDFHLYVCAAFLVKWSDRLVKMDFQEIMMFLQSLPTSDWTEKDIELLLSEAFIWQSLFRGSSAHLKGQGFRIGN